MMTAKMSNHVGSGLPVVLAGLVAGLACGPAQQQQAPSKPMGTILGRVTSQRTGGALEGVTVSALRPEADGTARLVTATTNPQGQFSLGELPAGASYQVRFELSGHVSRALAAALPDVTGNYPQGNAVVEVNLAMAPADASITGKVVAANGQPARGATVGLDLRGSGYLVVSEAVAANDGTFTFTGLPGTPSGLAVTLVVRPYDGNGDGQPDYDRLSVNTATFPAAVTSVDLDLRSVALALTLLFSDVDDGSHPAFSPIALLFNRAIDPISITLTDTTISRQVAVNPALDAPKTGLTLTAAGGSLSEGHDYRLAVQAQASNGIIATFIRSFLAVGSGTSLPAVTGLTVTPADADWNTTTFNLSWNGVAGASGYRVYGRDNRANPSYLELRRVGSTPAPTTTVTLPSSFDLFSSDSVQTPFASGAAVELVVVPENASGVPGSLAAAAAVSRRDNVGPVVARAVQAGDPDNTAGTSPRTITLGLVFPEYMGSATPTITLPNASMSASWAADPSLLGGRFTITVPAGVNGSGPYTVDGAQDSSGNPMATWSGTLSRIVELVSNGTFEGSPCTLAGWTTAFDNSASPPAAVSSPVASGACAVRLGNTGTTVTQLGNSSISQLVVLPVATTITFSARYYPYTNQTVLHDPKGCYLYDTAGFLVRTLFENAGSNAGYLTATADITSNGGQTYRLMCNSYQDGFHASGVYLDDISIIVQP